MGILFLECGLGCLGVYENVVWVVLACMRMWFGLSCVCEKCFWREV